MKKLIVALMLAVSIPVLVLAQECTTIEQDAKQAADAGWTETISMTGQAAHDFIDAVAKINGVDPSTLPEFDDVELRGKPNQNEQRVAVAFNKGCLLGYQLIDMATGQEINRLIEERKANK